MNYPNHENNEENETEKNREIWNRFLDRASTDEQLNPSDLDAQSSVKYWIVLDRPQHDSKAVHIEHARRKRDYYCPECLDPMIAKLGEFNQPHFAHKAREKGTGSGSGNGRNGSCTGEGNRHFRVKDLLYRMLLKLPRHEYKMKPKITIEKESEGYIPDITVTFGNEYNLAIEIVDSNPPSDAKREHWGDRLLEIPVGGWSKSVISDQLALSARLVPFIAGFEPFIRNLSNQLVFKTTFSEQLNSETELLLDQVHEHLNEVKENRRKKLESRKPAFNQGSRIVPEYGVGYVKEYECYKCHETILVYSGPEPDGEETSVHDILRFGVCYAHRYVRTSESFAWMNICPYCDASQSRRRVRAA